MATTSTLNQSGITKARLETFSDGVLAIHALSAGYDAFDQATLDASAPLEPDRE